MVKMNEYLMITGVTTTTGEFPIKRRKIISVSTLQELRIGSFITCDDDLVKVDNLFFLSRNKPKGIKLSERLLLFLGFRKQKNLDWNEYEEKEVEVEPYYFDTQKEYYEENRFPGLFASIAKFIFV